MKILAEINGNVCVRKLYEDALPENPMLGSTFIEAQPWHVEGQDVDASLAAYNAAEAAKEAAVTAKATVVADPLRQALITQLKGATNAQISAYVDAQVTDLASARLMLKRIILLLATQV